MSYLLAGAGEVAMDRARRLGRTLQRQCVQVHPVVGAHTHTPPRTLTPLSLSLSLSTQE